MRLSKKKLDPSIKEEIFANFYQLIADLNDPAEARKVFGNLLSSAEEIAITKRLAIIWALYQGKKYSQIREKFHISPATIAKLQRKLEKPGAEEILRRLSAEKWAQHWEKKIKNLFSS